MTKGIYQPGRHGIKVYRANVPKQLPCKKVKLSEAIAKRRAASAVDTKGTYTAYKCDRGSHWHIGHKL